MPSSEEQEPKSVCLMLFIELFDKKKLLLLAADLMRTVVPFYFKKLFVVVLTWPLNDAKNSLKYHFQYKV